MGDFNINGKKIHFFVLEDSVCFLNHILSNTGIDFVNNFQLIKYYSEKVLLPSFRPSQNFNFLGKGRFIASFCSCVSTKVKGFQMV